MVVNDLDNMTGDNTPDCGAVQEDASRSPVETTEGGRDPRVLSSGTVRRNMALNIMMDSIFVMGFAELSLALQPLLVYLKASNSLIGLATGTLAFGLPGIVASPWITRRFRYKKWYMFVVHIPYLGVLGLLGLGVIFSSRLHIADPTLLRYAIIMMIANSFFAGFVSIPHQEFVAACIPMSHRGRLTGFSLTIGRGLSLVSLAIAGVILLKMPKPMAYGWLFLMTWGIAQSGYIAALFAKERPTPIEKTPSAWSRSMLRVALQDKPFMRCVVLMGLTWILFVPFQTFLNVYGLNVLKMIPAKIALAGMVMSVTTIAGASGIGIFIDTFSPKRAIPFFMLLAFLALASPLVVRNEYGVYIGSAFLSLFLAGILAAFNALIYGIPKPENRAGNFAVQLIFFYAAGSIGPLLVGKLCDLLPYQTVFVLFAGLALLFFPISRWFLSILSDDAKAYS